MSTSRNTWSFDGKIFGCGFMSLNDDKLKKFDISRRLINTLAIMIAANRLDKVKWLFAELTNQQKRGLLSITIDYDQVTDSGYHSNGPLYFGDPIQVAEQFEFKEIEEFFTAQQLILDSEIAGHQPTLFRRQQTSDKVPENEMQADAALHALAMMMRASAGELTHDDLVELNRPSTPVIPVNSSYYHSDDSDSASASPSLRRK